MLASESSAVEAALARALNLHPYGGSGQIAQTDRTEADARLLWNALLECEPDELRRRIKVLTDFEERLLLFTARARIDDEHCREVLTALVLIRGPSRWEQLGWDLYLLTNGASAFQNAAQAFASEVGGIGQEAAAAARPLSALVERLRQDHRCFDDWLTEHRLKGLIAPAVHRKLLQTLLSQTALPWVWKREGSAVMHEWAQHAMPDAARAAWYRTFLELTHDTGWDQSDPILLLIVDRFGLPPEHQFWSTLAPDVCEAVRRWVINGDLTTLLKGERLQFWRRFISHMVARPHRSRSGEAVFIHFENCFAVQYVEMGRATYLFETNRASYLRRFSEPGLYNQILSAYRTGLFLGRYEHRGYDWESGAQQVVQSVLRRIED